MSEAPVIELCDVTVVFNEGTPNEVVALNSISLSFAKGETVMITGGNGSGKTTLLRAIAGTAPLKRGSVHLCGRDVTKWAPHRRARFMSYVYQDATLGTCPNLTVYENLRLATRQPWWSLAPQALSISASQLDLLEKTGLPLAAKAAAPVSVLSGGQRQALSLVLAYSQKQPIVLLDEFTSALDESVEANMMRFLRTTTEENSHTTLAVTHSPEAISEIASRRVHLNMGRVRND